MTDDPATQRQDGKGKTPVVLCILDGWGYRAERDNNAFALADTPHLDHLFDTCPHALLETSGIHVGLPDGQMGNSEVGHMNIGGGRIVAQDLPKIDAAIANGSLAHNDALQDLISKTRQGTGRCHLLGLLSPGGVHAHQDHIVALARILNEAGISVTIHAFLDGRDTPPDSAANFAASFEADLARLSDSRIGTVTGRYFAMDRDKRWERVAKAYDCIVSGTGEAKATIGQAINDSYAAGTNDEFVEPHCLGGYDGMADGDAFIMVNFRSDRAREILTALVDPSFDGFNRQQTIGFSAMAGMVSYSTALDGFLPAFFPPEDLHNTLGEVVANAGMTQLRIAETEKYAHVTFFLNGGKEDIFEGEDRILVPSPRVATYDLAPAMSAREVTDNLVAEILGRRYDLIICNFANPDMVGHTGILTAAMEAMEAVDTSIGRLVDALEKVDGKMIIAADHGNLEMMVDPETGGPHTAHTIGKVPALLIGGDANTALRNGALSDLAPTLLSLLKVDQPPEMTGKSLLVEAMTASQPNAEHQASA
ncbi:MAG: 2,3-bisphosphoglycerate-independent phosphoglycerate mutase [Alphaproteobacteria bacterium]|nr:MAG: 2,3-bisphosphoglycerate-independent phosphoglycerate mutase [Alphaproteobacteria bacterium]